MKGIRWSGRRTHVDILNTIKEKRKLIDIIKNRI